MLVNIGTYNFFFFFEFERSAQNSAGQNNSSIINIGIAEIIKKRNRDCQKHKKKMKKVKSLSSVP